MNMFHQNFPQETAKWRKQIEEWKARLGAGGELEHLRPWTRFNQPKGLPNTERVRAILDCVCLQTVGTERVVALLKEPTGPAQIRALMSGVFVNVSQNPMRQAFTNKRGIAKCLHTATQLYSFQRNRIILPYELMLLQGHSRGVQIPELMPKKDLHDLAGMGISLPSLGVLVAGVMLSVGL